MTPQWHHNDTSLSPTDTSLSPTDTSRSPTGPYWTLLDPIGLCRTLLDSVGPYWTLLDSVGPYWTLLDPTGPDPDPYHGTPPRSAPCPRTPLPGYHPHHHCPCPRCRHGRVHGVTGPTTVHQASSGYEDRPKIPLCLKLPFLDGQNGPVKNDTFLPKSLPNPHSILQKCHFCHFWWFSVNFDTFLDTTGFSRFSLFFMSQVFPRVFTKITVFQENHWKSLKIAFFSKMSPTDLILGKVTFSSGKCHFFVKNDIFLWDWIGVWDTSVSPSTRGVC